MTRPHWDFDYRLVSPGYGDDDNASDVVIALRASVDERELMAALSGLDVEAVETLVLRAPLFWYRVRFHAERFMVEMASALTRAGVPIRYVTSVARGSLALGERLDFDEAEPARPHGWPARATRTHPEPKSSGHWFVHETVGVNVDRTVCGTGAGTRLAVVDDEARDAGTLGLDREVVVGPLSPSRSALHGSVMVAWAVGGNGDPNRGIPAFTGVAPDASPRLYLIPKPGREVVSLPIAIVQAVADGADVIVCATYVEGSTSPLLDDALAFAVRLGRSGRGTAVVVPTGREISSPAGSLHSSLTLGFGDLASDPRVLCVAPCGRDGGWFLWADKRGMLRPFANRGPSVRFAAPGDDMSYPFMREDRLGHAESSGASALAAGVALLVLAANPEVEVGELYGLLSATTSPADSLGARTPAEPADGLPGGRDRDGHDAKCGYGRISATRACLAAADPIASALVEMGEDEASRRYHATLDRDRPYSAAFGAWAARIIRSDMILSHGVRVFLRHLRLVAGNPDRERSQPSAAAVRQLGLLADRLALHGAPEAVALELGALRKQAVAAARTREAIETACAFCFAVGSRLWPPPQDPEHTEVNGTFVRPVGAWGRSA